MFSTLSRDIKKTPKFYRELARMRELIKTNGIEAVLSTIGSNGLLADTAKEYFEKMKSELPMVGSELQSRVLAYLLTIQATDAVGNKSDIALVQ